MKPVTGCGVRVKTKRIRKPQEISFDFFVARISEYTNRVDVSVTTDDEQIYAQDCRTLAAWLLKAADYLDQESKVKP